MDGSETGGDAVVVGAVGGIGAALVTALVDERRYGTVHALSRQGAGDTRDRA